MLHYTQVKRKTIYILAALLGFIFMCGPASRAAQRQQTQELKGQVVDEKEVPIAGVVCTLTGGMLPTEGISVTSGSKGDFNIRGLLPGTYALTCSALGYQPVVKTDLVISSGPAPYLHVTLPTQKKIIQKVEVTASAGKVSEQSTSPPALLASEELRTLPIAEQKFKAFLPLVPGVIRTPGGRINIKGAVENKGMLLIDGAQAVDPITGSYDIDLSIDAIQSLNVYKAPYNIRYAGFSGGLTTIETKAPAYKW
ncbi:MAG: Plug and carboxypeptidase regulatory-like domain-containing protein, partial [Acidobacteria bacterium]|nr:Plug and carboxypeptidase regulatory-like domain-containing protein [Acidobacteriota bacterium]